MATLPQQFVDVVKRVSPSVVQIQTSDGLGSGVVFDDQGNIVTNAHVVGTATRFQVTASDNKAHSATLVGTYPQSDLAVIHVSDIKPPAATLADSAAIQVGQFALAIGNPLGLRSSVTEGIVSSVGRTVSEGNGVSLSSAIQTSAPINPGISGGALVNLDGQVIGIPTLAATEPQLGGGQAPGIGFAIPSNTVKAIARELIASGRVPSQGRAYLGVTAATVLGGGIVVERVQAGGPAARAGLQPGDVITALAGQDTATTDVLASLLQTLRPGQRVPIQVARQNGSEITLEVTLGSQPG
jgi:S1-C subfamily serine protease